jgi:hypothetical protein
VVGNSIDLLLSVNAWPITGQATSGPDLSQKGKRVKAFSVFANRLAV